jgi:hypothetical protein
LRESKPLCGFDFAEFHFVKLLDSWVEFGATPQTPKTKKPQVFWFGLHAIFEL